MDKILNYQISFFGNFNSIKATTENLNIYLPKFSNFFPSVINLASFDIGTNSIKSDNRLQLITNDQLYSVSFLPDRIDIAYNWNPMGPIKTDVTEIFEILSSYTKILEELFLLNNGVRLATSCNLLSNDNSSEEMNKIISRFSNPQNFFEQDNNTYEWNLRFNAQKILKFDNKEELTNHIISMERTVDNPRNQFLVLFDINTDPKNQSQRFTFSDLTKFSFEANERIKSYITEFENGK